MKLALSYYQSNDVVHLAKDLLGKFLITNIDGNLSGGIITETEAYAGIHDQASHAYGDRKTHRTKVMYRQGGISYIYLCYGIHYLFNIVSGMINIPHAILIRGILPIFGIDTMLKRTTKNKPIYSISNGPGKLTKALGITDEHNGYPLDGELIWIEDREIKINLGDVQTTKRIGLDYAGSDAFLPYRFLLKQKKCKKNVQLK